MCALQDLRGVTAVEVTRREHLAIAVTQAAFANGASHWPTRHGKADCSRERDGRVPGSSLPPLLFGANSSVGQPNMCSRERPSDVVGQTSYLVCIHRLPCAWLRLPPSERLPVLLKPRDVQLTVGQGSRIDTTRSGQGSTKTKESETFLICRAGCLSSCFKYRRNLEN